MSTFRIYFGLHLDYSHGFLLTQNPEETTKQEIGARNTLVHRKNLEKTRGSRYYIHIRTGPHCILFAMFYLLYLMFYCICSLSAKAPAWQKLTKEIALFWILFEKFWRWEKIGKTKERRIFWSTFSFVNLKGSKTKQRRVEHQKHWSKISLANTLHLYYLPTLLKLGSLPKNEPYKIVE